MADATNADKAESTATGAAVSKPIAENEHVQELYNILKDNNSPALNDFLSIVKQIGAMEANLQSAVTELAAMRTQLAEMEASNHPFRNALQKAVVATQAQVLEIRDKLAELKEQFIEGCKNAVQSFKEKGISALDNVARFLGIKPALESLRNNCEKSIQADNKAIANIETVSKEYHEAGKHIKNFALAIFGKEPAAEAKPMGSVAKTLIAPYRADRKCAAAIKGCAERAIGALTRLEERAEKPSIQADLKKFGEKVAQTQKEALAPEKPAPTNAER